jgi:adenylyltransferase/sulfurtransferase
VNVTFSNELVSKTNVKNIISLADVVLDCTDYLQTKYLLNDTCVIENKVLVYGSLYKFDGYVATFNYIDKNGNRTTNLRDAFPEIPTDNIPNCSEIGTLNSIVGIIGLMQANEVLKIVVNIGKPIINELLIYNSLDNSQYRMKLKSIDSHSESKLRISETFQNESYKKDTPKIQENLIISQEEFKKLLKENRETILVISVLDETPEVSFKIDENVPFYDMDVWLEELQETSKDYIIVCNRGNTSMMATLLFKEKHPQTKVLSLEGGVLEFKIQKGKNTL